MQILSFTLKKKKKKFYQSLFITVCFKVRSNIREIKNQNGQEICFQLYTRVLVNVSPFLGFFLGIRNTKNQLPTSFFRLTILKSPGFGCSYDRHWPHLVKFK